MVQFILNTGIDIVIVYCEKRISYTLKYIFILTNSTDYWTNNSVTYIMCVFLIW